MKPFLKGILNVETAECHQPEPHDSHSLHHLYPLYKAVPFKTADSDILHKQEKAASVSPFKKLKIRINVIKTKMFTDIRQFNCHSHILGQ